ncbi:OmpA family protein [Rhizosaccharibacter radicis]|uniref:OmpA family protein n=1 Tax=Rhizosaccharibacter radicis TaxID=2782605 RepID=A0ABT1VWA1_9PROT|nr:OmpA family protein [Acetobacteraceae bacterium KSS12]
MRRLPLLLGFCLLSGCATPSGDDETGRKYLVFFTKGSTVIEPTAAKLISKVAEIAKRHPERVAVVAGYAAAHGNLDADADLAAERARRVDAALQADGVPGTQIRDVARAPSNENPAVAARRVEIGFASAP